MLPQHANETSPAKRPALPDEWIERLFRRFEDWYGAKWAAQYGAFPRERVKATWAEELAGFRDQPDRLAYALETQKTNPFPPTLPEFLALCRQAPRRETPALLPHRPTAEEQERAEKAAAMAKEAVAKARERDPLDWAKRPRGRLAFDAVLAMAEKGDSMFAAILVDLAKAGVTDGRRLLKVWDGQGWVRA